MIGGMFGRINSAGIEYYNNLIDALILKGTSTSMLLLLLLSCLLQPPSQRPKNIVISL